jgi:hypothetical protein
VRGPGPGEPGRSRKGSATGGLPNEDIGRGPGFGEPKRWRKGWARRRLPNEEVVRGPGPGEPGHCNVTTNWRMG